MEVGGQRHASAALSSGKIRCPLYRRMDGWAPGPIWTEENLAPTAIRSPDRPVRRDTLYRLRYPGPLLLLLLLLLLIIILIIIIIIIIQVY